MNPFCLSARQHRRRHATPSRTTWQFHSNLKKAKPNNNKNAPPFACFQSVSERAAELFNMVDCLPHSDQHTRPASCYIIHVLPDQWTVRYGSRARTLEPSSIERIVVNCDANNIDVYTLFSSSSSFHFCVYGVLFFEGSINKHVFLSQISLV